MTIGGKVFLLIIVLSDNTFSRVEFSSLQHDVSDMIAATVLLESIIVTMNLCLHLVLLVYYMA